MPIYDYQCQACGHRVEVVHGLSEGGPAQCGACGSGPMKKLFAPPSIVFKGTGWAKKERGSSSAAKPSKSKGADGAGEGASGGASGGSDSAGRVPRCCGSPDSSRSTRSAAAFSCTP